LARLDRTRKKKGSNAEWTSPADPDAKITKMKDVRVYRTARRHYNWPPAMRLSLLAVVLVVAACDAPGVAPVPTPGVAPVPTTTALSLSVGALQLERLGTSTIMALARQSDGTTRDVTAEVTWGSSAPAVVSVERGLITATGIGQARIFALYQGQTAAVDVVAHRRIAIAGEVQVLANDCDADSPLGSGRCEGFGTLTATLDGTPVGGLGPSDHGGYRWHRVLIRSAAASPGSREVGVTIAVWALTCSTPLERRGNFQTRPGQSLQLIDRDTGEGLASVEIPVQTVIASGSGCPAVTIRWSIDVPVLTS
jgi:hypothetical protein